MHVFDFFSNPNKNRYHPIKKRIIHDFNKIRNNDKTHRLCHAPFKSMTFFHTGAVLACWYNKLFPLGNYPEDSIHDIWFSKRSETLRNFISHNDLSYGCPDCRKNLNDKNFYNVGAWRYDFLPEGDSEFPVSIDFQISNSCNLQCVMCNGEYSGNVRTNRENRELYKPAYDEDFFRQISSFVPYLKEASFSGGEPFFAKEFARVWDLFIELNPQINCSVSTNGTIFNDRTRYYLDALPFNIALSLDAITPEVYNKIRINANYDSVMENMEKFINYTQERKTEFTVKVCAMQQNWHDIPALIKFVNERDLPFLFNTVFYPPYCSLWSMSYLKLKEIAEYLKKFPLAAESATQKKNATCYQDLIRQIEDWGKEAKIREESGFYEKGIIELKNIFLSNIEQYIEEELKYLGSDCPVNLKEIEQLIENLIDKAPSPEIALKGMQFYASARVERWISEIVVRTFEKNYDRFVQIGLYEPNKDYNATNRNFSLQ